LVEGGVEQLVTLAWIRPEHQFDAFADLSRIADMPAGTAAVARRLAQGPSRWRGEFFHAACNQMHDPQALDRLFGALRPGPGAAELGAYLERLIRDRRWFDAWAVWVGALGPTEKASLTNLFNGGFERP